MRWHDLGEVTADARLADALTAAAAWRDDVEVDTVLRHVAGRRMTALGTERGATVVVKVFHGQRARGNHRRLEALRAAGLGPLVPHSLGHDPSGRVAVLGHQPGVVLDRLDDARFVAASADAGAALRRLHDSGAALDREWTLVDELAQLRRRATADTLPMAAMLEQCAGDRTAATLVPSHRDCHPRQLVVTSSSVHWIDLDDCAMAPRGLDLGNMAAHLTREGVIGRRAPHVAAAARERFLAGYGAHRDVADLARWELLSIVRLAGLAETRHGSPAERDALLRVAAAGSVRVRSEHTMAVPA